MASTKKLVTLTVATSRLHAKTLSPLSNPLRRFSVSHLLLGPKPKPAAKSSGPQVAKATTKLEKRIFPYETDPEKLAKFCCINYKADKSEGGPGPELREDDYYPDWLWELPNDVRPHYDIDPKEPEYWLKRKRQYQYQKALLVRKKPYGVV